MEYDFQGVNPTYVNNGKYTWVVDVTNKSNIILFEKPQLLIILLVT